MNNVKRGKSGLLMLATGAAAILGLNHQTQAAVFDWKNNAATTAWATGANWTNNAVPANDTTSDIARFNQTTYNSQPNAGTVSIAGFQVGDGTTATAPLTLAGANLTLGASGISIFATAGTVNLTSPTTLAASQSWINNSGSLFTISGSIANGGNTLTIGGSGNTALAAVLGNGAGGLTKIGAGTLNLNAVNQTYTGPTLVQGGTLQLTWTASTTNLISAGSTLNFGGGKISLNVSGNNKNLTQTFAGLTISPGASSYVSGQSGGSGATSVDFNAVSRTVAGGTLDFASGTGGVMKTKTANLNANGILGGWATFGGTSWAVSAGNGTTSGNITSLATLGTSYTTATTATNFDVTTSNTFTPTGVNSLRFNNAAARTATLNGAFTVGTGGILVTSTVGNNLSKIAGGASLTSGNGLDLIVIQNNPANGLTIDSKITGAVGLTKSGGGLLTLTNTSNDFAGAITLNDGTLSLGANSILGDANNDLSIFNNAILQATASFTLDNGAGNKRDLVLNAAGQTGTGGTIDVATGLALVVDGAISGGAGLTKTGAGTLSLGGIDTFTGNTTISGGILNLTGSLASSATVNSAATLTGTGTIAGTVSSSGGINPGSIGGVGTLSTGSINFASGSTWTVDIGPGANNADRLTVTGTANIVSGANLSFNQLATPDQGLYVLLTSTGARTGTFTGTAPSGYKLVYNTNEIDLQHLANQTMTSTSPATINILTGATTSISASLNNTAPTGSADLLVLLADNAGTGGTVSGLTSSTGSSVGAATSSTIGGLFTAGTPGLGKTWSIKNTDGTATNSPSTAGGIVNVYSGTTLSVPGGPFAGGGTIVLTNTGTNTPAGAKVTAMTLTQGINGTWSVPSLTLNTTVVNSGAPLSVTPSWDKTNLLNGAASSGSLSASFTNSATDGSTLAGAGTNDIGTFVVALQDIAAGNIAPLDRTGGRNNFGTLQTAIVGPGASLSGLSSQVSAAATSGSNRQVLGTTAAILAGANTSLTNPVTVGMEWRARLDAEVYGNVNAEYPTLCSDVVDVTGIPSGMTFALSVSYNAAVVLAMGAAEQNMYLGYFDGAKWVAAVDGNTGNNATTPQKHFQGSFAAFQVIYGGNLANYVGAYGVDTNTKTVWAVVDHNSQFAVIPEPASLTLLGLGAVGLLRRRRR